jgi:1,4-dihydroxy-2-naphthoate octaprenyltransferase
MTIKQRLAAWYQASRPPFYIATAAPLALGFILAGQDTGHWRIGRFLLVNLACFMIHLATNLADDLFDHLLGADSGESIGGSRVVQQGLITIRQLAWALFVLYFLGLLCAIALIHASGQAGLWAFAWFAFLSSLFYVAPPIKYGYRGLGELLVFLNMGVVMVGGSYWVLAETWRWYVLFYAFPVGLMVANILYFQSLPDMKTDAAVGKRTLAVRLGKRRAHLVFRLWWAATHAGLLALWPLGLASPLILLCLTTLPLLIKTDRLIAQTDDWLQLDAHGHLVRKMYLINAAVLIIAVIWR